MSQSIEQRLAALERQNRMFRRGAAVLRGAAFFRVAVAMISTPLVGFGARDMRPPCDALCIARLHARIGESCADA